ncbi:MAG: low specificity L-threonine aldolase [Hyphomicrobiales bacterium]|nr:low specificity L-threonine aldolase [Hyphomicrobiales bacterium]
MNLGSDNLAGASPKIMAALALAAQDTQNPYGQDDLSIAARAALNRVFEARAEIFFVATGTAANALALAQISKPWSAIFCHATAHINEAEAGAPESLTGGAKIVGIEGADGKINVAGLKAAAGRFRKGWQPHVQPAALSLSQVTECGTLYQQGELAALCAFAHEQGLKVHLDGARFANALVALGCTPAELSWKAGVDVLCLGATKDGAMACEAIMFFNPAHAAEFTWRVKRAGHVLSKGRLLGAQMLAWLDQDHWLDLARHANAMAAHLQQGLCEIAGVERAWPVEANEIFVWLPAAVQQRLRAAGITYASWPTLGTGFTDRPPHEGVFARFVTSFATTPDMIKTLLRVAK